jgi:hypothetical protein
MPEDYDNDDDDFMVPRDIKHPPFTPRDQGRLLRLRQDPSVASLLNMYDEHGCLDSNVFSNSPPSPRKGRPQRRRTGSSLRQLMGNPTPDDRPNGGTDEGDISWAERFLELVLHTYLISSLLDGLLRGQNSSSPSIVSSASSSYGTRTPEDLPYSYDHSHDNVDANCQTAKHVTFLSENNPSENSSNYPAFSSLEVELSGNISSVAETRLSVTNYPYTSLNPDAPQTASQAFQFLTEKRKPKDRSLPTLSTTVLSNELDLKEGPPLLPDMDPEQRPASMEPNTRELRDSDFVSRIPRLRHERRTATGEEVAASQTITRIPRAKGFLRYSTVSLAEPEPDACQGIDAENHDMFTSMPLRAHSRNSPYLEANMAFIMSPGQERKHMASDVYEIKRRGSRVRPVAHSITHDKENTCKHTRCLFDRLLTSV